MIDPFAAVQTMLWIISLLIPVGVVAGAIALGAWLFGRYSQPTLTKKQIEAKFIGIDWASGPDYYVMFVQPRTYAMLVEAAARDKWKLAYRFYRQSRRGKPWIDLSAKDILLNYQPSKYGVEVGNVETMVIRT